MNREVLDLLILSSARGRALHGYALIEELRQRSAGAFDIPEGTVYPALHRLERAGLLSSRWSAPVGRRKRVYELTKHGEAELRDRVRDWRTFVGTVDLVLEGA